MDSGRHGGNSPHSFSPPNYLLCDLSVWFLIRTHSFFSLQRRWLHFIPDLTSEVSAFCTAGCPLLLQPIPFPLLALWMALLLDWFSTSVLPSLVEDHICSYLVLERKGNANLESLLLNGKTPRHCFLGFCFCFDCAVSLLLRTGFL